jgi:hypothetical protein
MRKAWDAIVRNKLALLFATLIVSQVMTWRAVVAVEDALSYVQSTVKATSCGGYNDPCRVIVVGR